MKIQKISYTSNIHRKEFTLKGTIGHENERRFLVKYLPGNYYRHHHYYIIQGYLITKEGTSIRLRKKEGIYYQTVKQDTNTKGIKNEIEMEIPKPLYDMLWDETKGKRIEKTRYETSNDERIFELDIFNGKLKGLQVVEVEFPSKKEWDNFVPPEWFGAEITGIPEFSNKHLATHGVPQKLFKKLKNRK